MLPYLFFALFSGSRAASLAYSWPLSNFCINSVKNDHQRFRGNKRSTKDEEVGEQGTRDGESEKSGRGGSVREELGGCGGGGGANNTILALYSIMNPRSSDLCIFVTCFPNWSTGIGGWSASLIISPGAASSFFLVPETQTSRVMLTPIMDCLNTNDFYSAS